MRLIAALSALAAAGLLAGAAHAQDPSTDGRYRADLIKVMDGLAAGECPEDVMQGELLEACQTQFSSVTAALQMLGEPMSLDYVRTEGEGTEAVEVYQTGYAMGVTLTWGIGGVEDGRYTTLSVTSD
jgi:hypothetical protein